MHQLILLAVLIIVLLLASRLASSWLFEILGKTLYVIVLWPGVLVHELSHYIGCLAMFTRVAGFSVLPKNSSKEGLILGSVEYTNSGNPVKRMVISVLPFFGGVLILKLAAKILLGSDELFLPNADWRGWLFLYMTFAVGAHLAPSNRDLKNAALGFIGLAVIAGLVLAFDRSLWLPPERFTHAFIEPSIAAFIPTLTFSATLLGCVVLLLTAVKSMRYMIRSVIKPCR
jgi:hypothetical protein